MCGGALGAIIFVRASAGQVHQGDFSLFVVELCNADLDSRRLFGNFDVFVMLESEASPSLWVTPETLSLPTEGREAWC